MDLMDVQLPGERESRLFEDIGDESNYLESPGMRTPLIDGDGSFENDEAFQVEEFEQGNESDLDRDLSMPLTWRGKILRYFGRRMGSESINVTSSIDKSISVSVIFLRDCENSRPCSLSSRIDTITPLQLRIFRFRVSLIWQCILHIAISSLFAVSCFDGEQENGNDSDDPTIGKDRSNADEKDSTQFMFTLFSVIIICTDVAMRTLYDVSMDNNEEQLETSTLDTSTHNQYIFGRKIRARWWKLPVLLISLGIVLETYAKRICANKLFVWMGVFKPVIFFYVSSKARDGEWQDSRVLVGIT